MNIFSKAKRKLLYSSKSKLDDVRDDRRAIMLICMLNVPLKVYVSF